MPTGKEPKYSKDYFQHNAVYGMSAFSNHKKGKNIKRASKKRKKK